MTIASLILTFIIVLFIVVKILSYYDNPKLFSFFVKRFNKEDRKNNLNKDRIVFTGSSIVKFWETLETDLYPINVLNRGIAGTKINEIAYWTKDLVTKYNPRAVVLYAGSNDIQGNRPRTPHQVLDGFKEFTNKIHIEMPVLPIYFISISPSPAKTRWKNWTLIKDANLLISKYCESDNSLNFIDATNEFLNSEGQPIREYFKKDMIHFNEKGYSVWTSILKPILIRINSNE